MSFYEKLKPIEKNILQAMDRHPYITQRDQLKTLERKLNYSRAWLLCSFVPLILLAVFLIGGFVLITRLVGFVYPAYASFKAIDTPTVKDNELWLSYWIIFGALGVLEPLARPIFDIIPLYPLVKMVFLIWCYNPTTKGATRVYNDVIRPFILPYIGISSRSAVRSTSKPVEITPKSVNLAKDELEIEIDVISASNLPAMDNSNTCSYVLIYVQNKDGAMISDKCKTRAKISTRNPLWDEKMVLRFRSDDAKSGSEMVATVCHKMDLGQDLLIGKVIAPLSQFVGAAANGEYPLVDPDNENPMGVSGSLRLGVRFKK